MLYIQSIHEVFPFFLLSFTLSSGVHVPILQDCYTGIHMPWWFAASIPLASTLDISPNVIPPHPLLSLHPSTGPGEWCFSPCAHMFSLFNRYLWMRTCSVWFSVPVLVCWEWWFLASSMSLQRTWTDFFYVCIEFHGVYVPHFLYPAIIDGHQDWFQVFAIVNSAAVIICVHVSL